MSVRTVQRLCQKLEVSGCLSDRSDGGKVRLFSEEEREKILAHRDITSHRDTTNVALSDRPHAIAAIADEVAQRVAETTATTTTNIVAMALADRLGELRHNQESTAHVLETLREGLQQLLTMNEALHTEIEASRNELHKQEKSYSEKLNNLRVELEEERSRTRQREQRYQEDSEQARTQEQNFRIEVQLAREEAQNRETQLVKKLVEFQQAWQEERKQAQQQELHLLSEIEQTRTDSQQREKVLAEQLQAIQAESQQHALEIKQREEELTEKIENHFKDAKRPWWRRIWATKETTDNSPENIEKDDKQS